MKFASIREIRNQPGLLQSTLEGEPVTLTTNGRPFALVVGLDAGEDPGELERLIRQARAQRAISRIRARSQAAGADAPSEEDVEAEIRSARAERRA
jgi:antitoxin (DNA-binding transcriptional repressor) of toxin-antitoxin stability system